MTLSNKVLTEKKREDHLKEARRVYQRVLQDKPVADSEIKYALKVLFTEIDIQGDLKKPTTSLAYWLSLQSKGIEERRYGANQTVPNTTKTWKPKTC
jgi:hypothetical protein